jgi:hypothetical protein
MVACTGEERKLAALGGNGGGGGADVLVGIGTGGERCPRGGSGRRGGFFLGRDLLCRRGSKRFSKILKIKLTSRVGNYSYLQLINNEHMV